MSSENSQFCIKAEDLKFFDGVSIKIFRQLGVKIISIGEEDGKTK